MLQRTIEQLTFREKLRDCAHRTRELSEHIDQNLHRQLHELRKRTRAPKSGQDDDVSDVTVRNMVAAALDSQQYAEQFEEQIVNYATAIEAELAAILKAPRQ